MRRTALLDRKGMTLIEVLIAMLLFLIVSLALLQASIISVDYNAMGSMREEATSVVEARMNETRALSFSSANDQLTTATDAGSNLSSPPCPAGWNLPGVSVERKIGNATVTYCINRAVTGIGVDARQIVVRVDWQWKGTRYTHSISSIVRRT